MTARWLYNDHMIMPDASYVLVHGMTGVKVVMEVIRPKYVASASTICCIPIICAILCYEWSTSRHTLNHFSNPRIIRNNNDTNDNRKTSFLYQHILVLMQHYNAIQLHDVSMD